MSWYRWTPALSFGVFFLGCLIVLGIQTGQLRELRLENERLRSGAAELDSLRQDAAELDRLRASQRATERNNKAAEELRKLSAEVEELRSEAAALPSLRAENQRLRAEHDALAQAVPPPANDPFARAQKKADTTKCINNLKQIGLAARMWANDHHTNALPLDWMAIRKELSTPKVLTCPGDTGRTPALTWEQFDGSSVSYELPSAAPDEREPYIVYSRCPIHGSVGLSDGSVMSTFDPANLQRVDGNLVLQGRATVAPKP